MSDEKPCVPVDCPPMEEFEISGIIPHGPAEFYAEHPEGVFGVPEPVDFTEAKLGDTAYVYDVRKLDMEFAWVTETEWFDDQDDDITVKRQLWQLISEDEVTFPGWQSRHRELYGDDDE